MSLTFISVAIQKQNKNIGPLTGAFGSVWKEPAIHKLLILLKVDKHFLKTKHFELSTCCLANFLNAVVPFYEDNGMT